MPAIPFSPTEEPLLVAFFFNRFEPGVKGRKSRTEKLEAELRDSLEAVASLDDDRILRRFFMLIRATLRTNYFQVREDGGFPSYLSLKLDPSSIPDIPRPRPKFEIFVSTLFFFMMHKYFSMYFF